MNMKNLRKKEKEATQADMKCETLCLCVHYYKMYSLHKNTSKSNF